MAKKQQAVIVGIDTLRPYVQRALTDPDFRDSVREALEAAQQLYGDLARKNGGLKASATALATDKKTHKHVKQALEEISQAAETLRAPEKKRRVGRKILLTAGIVVGIFYNPWTGKQSREWIVNAVSGDNGLTRLEDVDLQGSVNAVADTATDVAKSAAEKTAAAANKTAEATGKAAGAAADKTAAAAEKSADAVEKAAAGAKAAADKKADEAKAAADDT